MWNKRAYRPLIWALLLSLLAHLVLIGRLSWFEWSRPAAMPMMVELAPVPLPTAVPLPQPAQPKPVVKKAVPAAKQQAPAEPQPPEPSSPPVSDVPPVEPPPVAVIPLVAPMLEKEVPSPVEAIAAEQANDEAPVQEDIQAPPPPRNVRIEYRLLHKGGVAGVERHLYSASEDGHYNLTSVAEPKGVLAVVLSDLVQKSEGMVTAQGLKPSSFVYQYGKNADKAQKAQFDWQSGKLLMATGTRKQEVALAAGTQDLMSFMYQFMFVPPLQEMQLGITNGKRLKTYVYGFDGEEALDMPFGKVDCLHIVRSNDDDKKTELWLATDYHYLPVRMKETEKDGTVTERVATRLQLE